MTAPPAPEPVDALADAADVAQTNPANVNCHACDTCVWSGGTITDDTDRQVTDLPFGEIDTPDGSTIDLGSAEDLLTAWADQNCDRGDCLHTTAARRHAQLQDPATMAAAIVELQAQIAQLRGDE